MLIALHLFGGYGHRAPFFFTGTSLLANGRKGWHIGSVRLIRVHCLQLCLCGKHVAISGWSDVCANLY